MNSRSCCWYLWHRDFDFPGPRLPIDEIIFWGAMPFGRTTQARIKNILMTLFNLSNLFWIHSASVVRKIFFATFPILIPSVAVCQNARLGFFPVAAGIRTHVSWVALSWAPLKEALTTELPRRGYLGRNLFGNDWGTLIPVVSSWDLGSIPALIRFYHANLNVHWGFVSLLGKLKNRRRALARLWGPIRAQVSHTGYSARNPHK